VADIEGPGCIQQIWMEELPIIDGKVALPVARWICRPAVDAVSLNRMRWPA